MIAYLVLAHRADPQLQLLVTTLLDEPRSLVLVHLDRKCADTGWLNQFEHARFRLVQRRPVYWGGFSVVQATLTLLREAYRWENVERFVLLSGVCFPLRSMTWTNDELLALPGSVVSIWGLIDEAAAAGGGSGVELVSKFHFNDCPLLNPKHSRASRLSSAVFKFLSLRLPYARRLPSEGLWRGSQFFVADRSSVREFIQPQRELERLLRFSFAPDEVYFTTLHARRLASGGNPVPVNPRSFDRQGAHFIRLRPRRRSLGERLTTLADVRQLTPEDVPDAVASGALFLRKCDLEVCKTIRTATSARIRDADSLVRVRPGDQATRIG